MNDINNLLKVLLIVNKTDLLFDGIFELGRTYKQNGDFMQLFKTFDSKTSAMQYKIGITR